MARNGGAAKVSAPRKPAGKSPGLSSKVDWIAVRDEYVSGDETYEGIAARYKVSPKTVEDHARRKSRENAGKAQGKSWGELRADFKAKASAKFTERATDSLAEIRQRWLEKAAQVGMKALAKLDARLDGEAIKDADIIQAAKLLSVAKVELSGPDGSPMKIEGGISMELDKLTVDELRRLAAEKP